MWHRLKLQLRLERILEAILYVWTPTLLFFPSQQNMGKKLCEGHQVFLCLLSMSRVTLQKLKQPGLKSTKESVSGEIAVSGWRHLYGQGSGSWQFYFKPPSFCFLGIWSRTEFMAPHQCFPVYTHLEVLHWGRAETYTYNTFFYSTKEHFLQWW